MMEKILLDDDPHFLKLEKLIKGVFDNVGIQKQMAFLEQIMEGPSMVIDMGFRVIAESPSVTQEHHQYYNGNIFLDGSCVELIRSHYIFRRMKQ